MSTWKKELLLCKDGEKKINQEDLKQLRNHTTNELENDYRGVSDPHPKKSKYPIDDYLDPSIYSNHGEMFPIPPLSPPPPSPSLKAMQNAEDLLEAAQQFLININTDLAVGGRALNKSPPSPDEGCLSSSSLSEESNPLVVKKIVNTALRSFRSETQSYPSPDAVRAHEMSLKGKRIITARREKQVDVRSEVKASARSGRTVAHHGNNSEKVIKRDLHVTRKSIDNALELAQEVNKNLKEDGMPKTVFQQRRGREHHGSILSKSLSQHSLDSGGEVQFYCTSETSGRPFASQVSPSRKTHMVSRGSKPPPNSPVSVLQTVHQNEMRGLKISQSRSHSPHVSQRVHIGIPDNLGGKEKFAGAVDRNVGADPNVEFSDRTATVDVAVNTSYTLPTGVMAALPSEQEEGTATGKVTSNAMVGISTVDDDIRESEDFAKNAADMRIPLASLASSAVPGTSGKTILPQQQENVAKTNKGTFTVSELKKPRSAQQDVTDLSLPNPGNLEELLQKEGKYDISQELMDQVARNVSYEELVEDIAVTRELLSPKGRDASEYIDGNSLSALIEHILLSEVRKVAGEAQPPRPRMNGQREIPEDIPIRPTQLSRRSQVVLEEELLEEKLKRILLTDDDSVEEEPKIVLERIFTPQRSPSPSIKCTDETEDDYLIVPTPPVSPPAKPEEEYKELEEDIVVKVKTPPTTPKRSVEAMQVSLNLEPSEKITVSEKIPQTPRSQKTDSCSEEISLCTEEADCVSTPTLTLSERKINIEQSNNSRTIRGGKLVEEVLLPYQSEKSIKYHPLPAKEVFARDKENEKSSFETRGSEVAGTTSYLSKIKMHHTDDEKPTLPEMVECETQTDARNLSYPLALGVQEPVQMEKYQDPDTTASFSMEPELDTSVMEKSVSCLSEGEVKFKSKPDVQVINLDCVSMGEVVPGKMAAAVTTFGISARDNIPASSAASSSLRPTETWSEGEIRERWTLIQSHVTSSTASDGSQSLGEIGSRVLQNIPSEGEIPLSDQEMTSSIDTTE